MKYELEKLKREKVSIKTSLEREKAELEDELERLRDSMRGNLMRAREDLEKQSDTISQQTLFTKINSMTVCMKLCKMRTINYICAFAKYIRELLEEYMIEFNGYLVMVTVVSLVIKIAFTLKTRGIWLCIKVLAESEEGKGGQETKHI